MLNKSWRFCATVSAFTLFGVGGIILSVVLFPLLQLRYKKDIEKRRSIARKYVQKIFKFFLDYMQWMGICEITIKNAELLQQSKGQLIIANHPSLIDVVVLISLTKNADCVVKSDLWNNPFLKGVVGNIGYINNQKNSTTFIEDCKTSFIQGNNLIVFPEGTRTTEGQALKFRRGVANIAVRSQVNLVPIVISVTPTTLTKELPWYKVPDKKFVVEVVVNKEIAISDFVSDAPVPNQVRALTRYLLEYYNKELNLNERVD